KSPKGELRPICSTILRHPVDVRGACVDSGLFEAILSVAHKTWRTHMPNSHIRELTDEQNVALHVMERAFDSGGELGGIVNLTGPYGSGKTALAHILRQQLQQSDVQVFALMMEPDAAVLGSTLSRIVANASPQPLVVMIDEWDRLLTRTS